MCNYAYYASISNVRSSSICLSPSPLVIPLLNEQTRVKTKAKQQRRSNLPTLSSSPSHKLYQLIRNGRSGTVVGPVGHGIGDGDHPPISERATESSKAKQPTTYPERGAGGRPPSPRAPRCHCRIEKSLGWAAGALFSTRAVVVGVLAYSRGRANRPAGARRRWDAAEHSAGTAQQVPRRLQHHSVLSIS